MRYFALVLALAVTACGNSTVETPTTEMCPAGLVLTAQVCTSDTVLCQERPANGERLGRSVTGCQLDSSPTDVPHLVECIASCPARTPGSGQL